MYKIINIKVVSMKKLKIMIVDDSAFSIAVLKNLLESEGHEVVGSAMNIKEAVRISAEVMPDLITMDMTLPDGDGIECSKNILKHKSLVSTEFFRNSAWYFCHLVFQRSPSVRKSYLYLPVI